MGLSWTPRFSDVAASGDLGFTVGEAVQAVTTNGVVTYGYLKYLTVWQKQNDGGWKFVADAGNREPAPAP